ncbi:MAG: OmpA family protein [Desulfosarcina sp.]|jgi:OOP family OmpA-OmpF porin
MKKSLSTIMTIGLMFSLLTTVSVQAFEVVTRDMIEKETITRTDLIRTADNFIILFDTSGSTNEMVPGKSISKIQAAKSLLKERNAWLPDLGFQAGLYIYTDHETLVGTFKEVYGMQAYDRERFAAAIDQLPEKGQGGTTLNAGLSPLRKVVAGLSGKTAIIMFTDGKVTRMRGTKKPLQIAQEIARDNDVCFYLISSATEEMNAQVLESVTQVNTCSRVIPIAAFMDNPQYLSGALFTVKTTSYTRLKPMTQTVGVFVDDILFDYDSSVLRSEYNGKLDELGDYLVKNPDTFLVVGGFADSRGDDEYNMWLSKRRALSVKSYLSGTHDIDGDRIILQWFGEQNPAADNAAEEGRQLNRRVELAVGTGSGM